MPYVTTDRTGLISSVQRVRLLSTPDSRSCTFAGLVGSLLLSTIGFVLPVGLFERLLRLRGPQPGGRGMLTVGARVSGHTLLVIFGVSLALLGTASSLQKLLSGP